jgi:predicted HicB family RNase H-like nuclease
MHTCHRDTKEKLMAATPAHIQVRTSEENRAWLREEAKKQDRSMNWLISKILDDARIAGCEKKNEVQ